MKFSPRLPHVIGSLCWSYVSWSLLQAPLKLRCSTLCVLFLANLEHHHAFQPLPQVSSSASSSRASPSTSTSSTRLWQSANDNNDSDALPQAIQDALAAASNTPNDQEGEETKGKRLRKRLFVVPVTVIKKAGGLVLRGGRSLRDLVWSNSTSTQMEAAPDNSRLNDSNDQEVSVWKRKQNDTDTDDSDSSIPSSPLEQQQLPKGPRWAVAHPETDLSGTWKPLVTKEFQQEYDLYLQNCGTSYMFRKIVLPFASTTRETIHQVDQGRVLHFHGTAPGGNGWKRSLIASGADNVTDDYEIVHAEFLDPDKELVKVEAWWEQEGRVHKSVLRNKPKVCGGEFESKRYLVTDQESGEKYLVCESIFHPAKHHLESASSPFKPASVRWKYQRDK